MSSRVLFFGIYGLRSGEATKRFISMAHSSSAVQLLRLNGECWPNVAHKCLPDVGTNGIPQVTYTGLAGISPDTVSAFPFDVVGFFFFFFLVSSPFAS